MSSQNIVVNTLDLIFQVFNCECSKCSAAPQQFLAEKMGMRISGKAMGKYMGKEPEAYLEKPVDSEILRSTVASVCL